MIYLDDQTRPYLERKFKTVADSDFIGKRIQGALQADRERIERIANCDHQHYLYHGSRIACGKCDGDIKQLEWTQVTAMGEPVIKMTEERKEEIREQTQQDIDGDEEDGEEYDV